MQVSTKIKTSTFLTLISGPAVAVAAAGAVAPLLEAAGIASVAAAVAGTVAVAGIAAEVVA